MPERTGSVADEPALVPEQEASHEAAHAYQISALKARGIRMLGARGAR